MNEELSEILSDQTDGENPVSNSGEAGTDAEQEKIPVFAAMETDLAEKSREKEETAADSVTSEECTALPTETEMLSDMRMAELLANPMFIHFARGRSGSLEELCRDFNRMLSAGGSLRMPASDAARMAPAGTSAAPDVALSERQRALARAAGMSYREYYELASTIPGSISSSYYYKGEKKYEQ